MLTTTDLQQQWQRLVEAGKLRWAPWMKMAPIGRSRPMGPPPTDRVCHVDPGMVTTQEGVEWFVADANVSAPPDFGDPATEGIIARQAREALGDATAFVGSICTDDGTLTGWIAYGRTKKYGPELTDTIGGPAATRVGAWMNAVEGR